MGKWYRPLENTTAGARWRDVSIGPGSKGSFQAVKLQRPARTTVCSHSTRDMAAMRSIESNQDHNDSQDEGLSCCEQSSLLCYASIPRLVHQGDADL